MPSRQRQPGACRNQYSVFQPEQFIGCRVRDSQICKAVATLAAVSEELVLQPDLLLSPPLPPLVL